MSSAAIADDPTSRTFTFQVRVYYEDTDTGGIVFYANYLKFFERARTEWLRHGSADAPGISQQQVGTTHGLMFVVRSTSVDYKRPARLDDAIRIVSRVERLGRVGIDFHQEAYLDDAGTGASALLAVGRIRLGCVSRDVLKPAAIPDAVRLIFVDR